MNDSSSLRQRRNQPLSVLAHCSEVPLFQTSTVQKVRVRDVLLLPLSVGLGLGLVDL